MCIACALEGRIDLRGRACFHHNELRTFRSGCFLCQLNVRFSCRAARIDKQTDRLRLRNQFGDGFEQLWRELGEEHVDACGVATGAREASTSGSSQWF